MNLQNVKDEFRKHIVIRDEHAVDMILATLIGNALIPRDPLWVMMVAPSSGGKSTLLAPCQGIPSTFFLDDLTEKTLLSAYKLKGKEVSLLKLMGSGIMCFSDFTSILSKNPMSKNEILGQLRLVYDGNFSKRTGIGEIKWSGKVGVIACCTPDIYHQLEGVRSMGERFIYYNLEQPSDEEILKKQEETKMSSRQIAETMHPLYREYVEGVQAYVAKHGLPELNLTAEFKERISRAAFFCASAKATIHLDFKTGVPDSLVSRPGVGRDHKMFNTIAHTLQLMNSYEIGMTDAPVEEWMIEVIEKCAYSSVSRERRKILEILAVYETSMTASDVGSMEGFGLQKASVEKFLWVLHAVGLIEKDTSGSAHKWFIANDDIKRFVLRVSKLQKKSLLPPDLFAENQAALEEFDRLERT